MKPEERNELMNQLCRAKGIEMAFGMPGIWLSCHSFLSRKCLFCEEIFEVFLDNENFHKALDQHAAIYLEKFGAWI